MTEASRRGRVLAVGAFLALVPLLAAPAAAQTGTEEAEAAADAYEPGPRDPLGTRFVNVPTPFPVGAGMWELLFVHRFQETVQDGDASNLWGIDGAADIGFGGTVGLTRSLDVALYRFSFQETWELAGKYLVFEQAPRVPLSIALRAGVDRVERDGVADPTRPFAQLIVSRRFALPNRHGQGITLFAAPSWAGDTPRLRNAWNVPLGIAFPLLHGRMVQVEVVPANRDLDDSVLSWNLGFTHDAGRHIFEIVVGNSRATTVDQMLGSDFPPGYEEDDVRLGFNLIRLFPYRKSAAN